MKIIALIPVKNEAWILRTCLSSLQGIADEVIVLDDDSSDSTPLILSEFKATVFTPNDLVKKESDYVDMSIKRNFLLSKGREAGGTHFIWLDADEAFSSNFKEKARVTILELQPGQKMFLPWITLWKNISSYRVDDIWCKINKDFIFCDDRISNFNPQFLSESRTPSVTNKQTCLQDKIIPLETGVVLHYQFVSWEKTQWKQAWYRCNELIEGSRGAKRINNTYAITLDNNRVQIRPVPGPWARDLPTPEQTLVSFEWYKSSIQNFFTKYGIEKFEPLQIWHIPPLRDTFLEKMNREPRPEVFNPILIYINKIRHKIKAFLSRKNN